MAGTGRKWLKGCGISCGVIVLLNVVGWIVAGLFLTRPFTAAVSSQDALDKAFGPREAWVPPADGPTAARLEVFIAVRTDLDAQCAHFRDLHGRFAAMDELDKQGDVSAGEALKAVAPLMGSVLGMAGDIGRYLDARNQALLDHGMGLGEYIWIYVLAYNAWLGHEPNIDFGDGGREGEYDPTDRTVLATLIEAHAGALEAAGRADEAAAWRAEAGRIGDTPSGVPFARDGVPADLAARFEPYRDALEAVYCEATGSLELGRIRQKGLSFHGD